MRDRYWSVAVPLFDYGYIDIPRRLPPDPSMHPTFDWFDAGAVTRKIVDLAPLLEAGTAILSTNMTAGHDFSNPTDITAGRVGYNKQ